MRFEQNMSMIYVHIPKCGSSFATILLRLACNIAASKPVLEPGGYKTCGNYNNGHAPLRVDPRQHFVITMLRSPASRVASGFMHNMHDAPLLQKRYKLNEHAPVRFWENRLKKMSQSELEFLFGTYQHTVGCCVTNMLTGFGCGSPCSRSRILLATAKLPHFHFIGINELWNDSISYFARLHDTVPRSVELMPGRSHPMTNMYKTVKRLSLRYTYDDDHVYSQAVALMVPKFKSVTV